MEEGGTGAMHGEGREKRGLSQLDEWEEGVGRDTVREEWAKGNMREGGWTPPTHPVAMRGKQCGGKDCLVCQTEAKGKCRVESVVYEVTCGRCEKKGKRKVYVGESRKSAWERGGRSSEGMEGEGRGVILVETLSE